MRNSRVIISIVSLLVTACIPPTMMSIYNGCNGSWVRVTKSDGTVLLPHLAYGQGQSVNLETLLGTQVSLLAAGYSLANNRPLGSATWSVYVPNQATITGPTIQPWQIMYLQTTDPHGGCQR